MNGYDHFWSEDDAGTPDRERVESAFLRLAGQDFEQWKVRANEMDLGDAFKLVVPGSPWVVVLSYDGGHIYRKKEP